MTSRLVAGALVVAALGVAVARADTLRPLVTEDTEIHRKADRLGLGDVVATIGEAANILRGLFDRTLTPPPAVVHMPAYNLDVRDPIFEGLREDYGEAEFNAWLSKARREGRDAWVIDVVGAAYAGLTIIKRESEIATRRGKILKVCTFKVAVEQRGRHYGELLLKTLFVHAAENHYQAMYLEVLPKHEELIKLLEDFGFANEANSGRGELVMVKSRIPDDSALSALEHQVRYGPPEPLAPLLRIT